MEETVYYKAFESRLEQELLRVCTNEKMQAGQLLTSEDIDAKWREYAPEYLADAVHEVQAYPQCAVLWAAYAGLAVARWWHDDWARYSKYEYSRLYGSRGFDNLDDHVVNDILGYKPGSDKARKLEAMMEKIASMTIGLIRHENAEPQSERAYRLFASAERVVFRMGASLELYALGYHWQKAR